MEDKDKVELSDETIERLAKKVSKEVRRFSLKDISIRDIITVVIVIMIFIGGYRIYANLNDGYTSLKEGFESLVRFENGADDHDLVIDDNGIGGYLAADFEEAILGKTEHKKEINVYTQEVSDVAELIDTGLFNWSAFTKTQMITYKGSVDYYVDMNDFDRDDIEYNKGDNTVTIYIPHVSRKDININEDDILFSDPENGLLAFGDIKATPEDIAKVQKEARNRMEEKLEDDKVSETADRFAKLTVWEIYSPIVKSVGKDVSLVVEFK